jgi:peroxiredoxin
LRDQRGVEVASETPLKRGPLLLTFYSGSGCPACSRDLQAFESFQPSVEARGASLMSISQQMIAENAEAHAQLKLGLSAQISGDAPPPFINRCGGHKIGVMVCAALPLATAPAPGPSIG